MVQVMGVEPYIASIKSRVPYRSATPAYGGTPGIRTQICSVMSREPSPIGPMFHIICWLLFHYQLLIGSSYPSQQMSI